MSAKTVHVELLAGSVVHDTDGARVGRIVSLIAEPDGEDWVVREVHLGAAALLKRFGISAGRLFGWHRNGEPLRVPWDLLDLSDPENPRLLCPAGEIRSGSKPPRPPSGPRRKSSAE